MRKRLTALLLCLCMVLAMLPVPAMAAVSDLLGNSPEQNAGLLEKLESFTGESSEEARQLLDSLGLLDEDGNLITDQTIDLDGKQYTLEEMEVLLADPSTDLTRVAQVDGVPIALQDLQTIVAIERELQYLQETYFSGRTFSEEARENLNGLLNQMQTQGMTLNATTPGNEVVLHTEGQGKVRAASGFDHSASFISSGIASSSVPMKEGDTFSVKFKLAIPESIQKLRGDIVVGFANHMDVTKNNMLTSVKAETITVNENMDPDTEYTLEYTVGADDGPNNGLYLYVSYQFFNLPSGSTTTIEDPLGDVYGGVSFYEPSGFLFGSGDGSKIEDYNLFFVRDIEETTLVDSWAQTGTADDSGVNAAFATFNIIKSTAPEDYQQLDKTLGYLQSCIDGELIEDDAIRFQIESEFAITNSTDTKEALLSSLGLFANYNGMTVGENPYNFKVDTGFSGTEGFPINLTVNGGTKSIKFNAFRTEEKSDAELKYLPRFIYVLYGTDDTTEDTYSVKNVYYTNTTTSNTTVTLVDPKTGDESKPTLTITAPEGTYKSGELVPITITGDEYIQASDEATVTINNTPYKLSDLHSSTSGKFISFLYEVKEIDSATLTVQSVTGITDFFGNPAKEVSGESISGVELATPQMKNAVESLGVTYADGVLHFAIAAKQDEAYQTYYQNNGSLMQLLITVDDGAPVTHAVTVGEDTVNNGFTFTAEPYTIAPTSQDQTVTVQLQVNTGTASNPTWVTVNRVTQTVTVPAQVDVTGVTVSVADGVLTPDESGKYTVALDEMEDKTYKLQAAFTPDTATYQTGTWHSSDEDVATVSNGGEGNPEAGTIQFKSQTGEVEFWFVADNGTEATEDDEESPHLTFVVTAGDSLILSIPPYAQDSLIQADKDATVSWVTNVFDFYPDADVTFTVSLFAGTGTNGTPTKTYTVENTAASPEKSTECTIPAADLPVTYPQSQYTVQVSMTSPEARSDDTGITVLSPPTEMRITADKTSITDGETLELNYSINNTSATGALSATRMKGGTTLDDAGGWLSQATDLSSEGTVTFTPSPVEDGALYDTYTITFTEDTHTEAGASFAPSTDSLVLYVYKSDALSIQSNGADVESISLNNASKVDEAGELPTDSQKIMALRQELGLIEYVSINAEEHNWSSFRDGIQWALSEGAENVAINYRQGGLWDNIEDLSYETYLPQTQMAISATGEARGVTVTATHAATGMNDTVTVDVETLQDKLYMFQATPAQETTVTYTTGEDEERELTTNTDGLLVVYEPDSIASDVQFRSGNASNPNLGTIAQAALSSGERDAAKLQLYPLNAITLVPAAKAELYLVQPDGTPFANQTVTLRGGVYLEDNYCGEDVRMGPGSGSMVPGNTDGTYTTDGEGKLTVHMDATQFIAEGYTGPLTNAALDYWFELRGLGENDEYYPVLVNVQGSMSADRILRTGSAVVMLEEVPAGEENKPYLTAQTLSYGEEDGSGELQVRSVLDSTGKVGPNSTYKYAELTSYFTLWGVNNDKGSVTVSMTGENGYAPEGQLVQDDTFPFASIPIITNTTVLTKATMTDSGWLEAATADTLQASVYQNGELVKQVTMPFQVIDLTEVGLVNEGASALIVDMQGSFVSGIGKQASDFSFTKGDSNSVTRAFDGDVKSMLNQVQKTTSPMFRVLITPSEDNTVFNAVIWGGYNSLELNDFDYTEDGFSMDYQLMESELDVGVPSVNEIGEMAAGTYDPADTLTLNAMGGTHNNLDFGAQLEGYYEGQFYYDTEEGEWLFRTISGGFTAGAGVSFQANVNAWVGPIPITGSFGAGIALQLDYKAATVYTDQQDAATLATWTDAAQQSESVNDYLTTLRINGYIDAFGGFGFDYTIIALKIGLFGQLAADSTNRFLSRTYLADEDQQQINGQALGITGEVGIKFVAKFLFISYETVLGSGSITYKKTFNDWGTIEGYWGGNANSSTIAQTSAPTLLSRSYLEAYANGAARWNSGAAQFGGTATVVQEDANPGSEPAVNDDGSLSVYISDEDSGSYFDSRIRAGSVGAEGTVINDAGHGDMSPSLSGNSSFTVAAWIRLFEDLEDKEEGKALTAAEQKQLLNSTEIMVATTSDKGGSWKVQQLTENASPDLAPVTATNGSKAGSKAIVFWRSAYASDENKLLNFDTQNAIYYSRYSDSGWSEPKMAYNGSIGSVVGLQASMLSDGTALVAFTVDRDPTDGKSTDYEMAYRVIDSGDTLGDLVVLTSDAETDTNPQAAAVSDSGTGYFVLAWYSTQDGGDIRLQAVGSDGQPYSGGSGYAVPASVKAVSQEDGLVISSDFRLAKRAPGSTIDGLTLVWAETVPNGEGQADHSVLYGAQLCKNGETLYLSTPQDLITLPERTLANSFSAWRDGSGKVSAYIFGTYYDPTKTETVPVSDGNDSTKGYEVAADTDKLLTGGGTMRTQALSVDSVVVDYANLQTNAFTPVVFTLRNTGTTALDAVTVAVGANNAKAPSLNPGDTASVTVLYKTGAAITNPAYAVTADDSKLASDTLYLDYNDIGISSMKVVEESQGKRTVLVTLYNDSAAKLADATDRTVELRFYSDAEHTEAANVTLVEGTQNGVTLANDAITLTGDSLTRLDQGSMALLITYDLASYVTGTLRQKEVPASGVYLYANASVKENDETVAEYAQGNNSTGVQLTGAYARTGEETTLDAALDNTGGATTANVTLKNNCLQEQPDNGTLLAVLLDEKGNALETQTVTNDTALSCEETKQIPVKFENKGADVILLYAPANTTELQLRFTNMNVGLRDFVEDPANPNVYTYTLPGNAPASTSVIFVSDDEVTVNGKEQGNSGSVEVAIPTGSSTITVKAGEKTYILTVKRTGGGGGGGTAYPPNILETEHGTVTVTPTQPQQNDKVTITATPDEGYKVGEVIVTKPNGQKVTVTPAGDGEYTFIQPSGTVTIDVTFVPKGWPFVDVAEDDWFFTAVKYVYEHGIMVGTSSTTFEPNSSVTRGQVVQMLYNLEGQPAVTGDDGFTDVQTKDWWFNAVVWGSQNGVVSGYGDGTFQPERNISRQEFAQMLYNYAQFKGYDLTAAGDLSKFPDGDETASWARTALSWANGNELINGHDDGTLEPGGTTTRGQAASILMKFDQNVAEH